MAGYRQRMMNNASGISGADSNILTPERLKDAQNSQELQDRLTAIIDRAVEDGKVTKDDKLMNFLLQICTATAQTVEGKFQAVQMAIWFTEKINLKFEVKEK